MRKLNKKQLRAIHAKKNRNRLPVQVGIIVPSTEYDKQIPRREFDNRIDETRKFMSSSFGGDTTINARGGYVTDDGNKLISENTAIVESSMTHEKFDKRKELINKFIKEKQEEWKQDTLAYEVEDDLYIYPKKKYIDSED
jgi:hypothetical protein